VKEKLWWWPTTTNDYTPHILQKTAFFLLGGLVLLTFIMTNLQTMLWQASDWLVGTILPAVVVLETNEARQSDQLLRLRRNEQLDQAATLKAEHMAAGGYFAHYSPDGVSPWHWFSEVGYQYAHAGENLAVHFTDSRALVEAWLQSPTHRANIMNNQYLEIGVGTAEGEYQGFKTIFVVQLFGTPADPVQPYVLPVVTSTIDPTVNQVEMEVGEAVPLVSGDAQITPDLIAATETVEALSIEPAVTTVNQNIETVAVPLDPTAFERTEVANESIEVTPVATESFVSISTNLVPLPAQQLDTYTTANAGSSLVGRLSTTPNTVLQYLYIALGMVVSALLLVSVLLAFRFHRPMQVVYGVSLLLLMTGLFYLHTLVTAGVVIAAPMQ
jgi:hypothetical protein